MASNEKDDRLHNRIRDMGQKLKDMNQRRGSPTTPPLAAMASPNRKPMSELYTVVYRALVHAPE